MVDKNFEKEKSKDKFRLAVSSQKEMVQKSIWIILIKARTTTLKQHKNRTKEYLENRLFQENTILDKDKPRIWEKKLKHNESADWI